jgi:hypothetical protein
MAIMPAELLNTPMDEELDMEDPNLLPEDPAFPQDDPIPGPDQPDIASIFAMMESGGSDILTEEEQALIGKLAPPSDNGFDDNLALELDDSELDRIADKVIEDFDNDEESRKDWLEREAMGIRLLGVSENVEGGANFDGAAEVVHPLLMEAVLQFQSRALAEIWPPDGPCKTVVMGELTREKEEQAKRVQDYVNYSYTIEMADAFSITDQLLFRLPLSGSVFTKLYWCPLRKRIVRKLVNPGDFVVPYHCDTLETAPRTTHILRLIHNDVRKLQLSGFYQDIELVEPSDEDAQTNTILRDEIDAADSRTNVDFDYDGQRHVILEQTCYLKLKGIDDEEDLYSPYIVHVEKEQNKVLAIYRNWNEDDPLREPKQHVIHYKFLPGLGFYGFGLLHIMGGLTRSATGALRALLDAAHFSNLPGGYRSRDAKIRGKTTTVSPGEWLEVETTGEELSKAFFPLPYKEPSAVLFNLLGLLDQLGRRLGGATEVLVGDANNHGPVGTTLALIEQGLKVMSAIHMRLHRSQQSELRLFADLCSESMPEEGYPYQIPGGDRTVMAKDFDSRVDVIPVSDPNVVSATHRIALAQAQMDLANAHPDLFDMRAVCERLLQAMRVPDYEQIMPPQKEPPRADPVTENSALLTGKPVAVFPDQDHSAHITICLSLIDQLDVLGVGAAGSTKKAQITEAIFAHAAEHLAAKTRIEYEQALMGMGIQLPQQPVPPEVENQIAQAAAAAAQTLHPEPGPDPQETEAARRTALEEERMRTKAEIDGERARADIRRKDAVAAADLERKTAGLSAELNRSASRHEADLLQRFISANAQQALAEEQDDGLPMGGEQP